MMELAIVGEVMPSAYAQLRADIWRQIFNTEGAWVETCLVLR
jgi:hypothetical protein